MNQNPRRIPHLATGEETSKSAVARGDSEVSECPPSRAATRLDVQRLSLAVHVKQKLQLARPEGA